MEDWADERQAAKQQLGSWAFELFCYAGPGGRLLTSEQDAAV